MAAYYQIPQYEVLYTGEHKVYVYTGEHITKYLSRRLIEPHQYAIASEVTTALAIHRYIWYLQTQIHLEPTNYNTVHIEVIPDCCPMSL